MKAYAVHTPEEVVIYHGTELEPDERGLIYEVVIAKSAQQAKNIIRKEYALRDETLKAQELARDVDLPAGSISGNDSETEIGLIIHACVLWHDFIDPAEFYQWRGWIDQCDWEGR